MTRVDLYKISLTNTKLCLLSYIGLYCFIKSNTVVITQEYSFLRQDALEYKKLLLTLTVYLHETF